MSKQHQHPEDDDCVEPEHPADTECHDDDHPHEH